MGNDFPEERLIKISQVLERVPVARSTWWAGVKSGKFPRPIKLGARTTVWRSSEIQQLMEEGIDTDEEPPSPTPK